MAKKPTLAQQVAALKSENAALNADKVAMASDYEKTIAIIREEADKLGDKVSKAYKGISAEAIEAIENGKELSKEMIDRADATWDKLSKTAKRNVLISSGLLMAISGVLGFLLGQAVKAAG